MARRTNYAVNNMRHATNKEYAFADTSTPWKLGDRSPTGTTSGTGNGTRVFRGKIRNASQKLHITDASDWMVNDRNANYIDRWDVLPEQNASASTIEPGMSDVTNLRSV